MVFNFNFDDVNFNPCSNPIQHPILVNGSNLLFAGRRVEPLSDVVDIPPEQLVQMTLQQLAEGRIIANLLLLATTQPIYHHHSLGTKMTAAVLVVYSSLRSILLPTADVADVSPHVLCSLFSSESICGHVAIYFSQSTCTYSMHTPCVGHCGKDKAT